MKIVDLNSHDIMACEKSIMLTKLCCYRQKIWFKGDDTFRLIDNDNDANDENDDGNIEYLVLGC